jgi:hypothetical protein
MIGYGGIWPPGAHTSTPDEEFDATPKDETAGGKSFASLSLESGPDTSRSNADEGTVRVEGLGESRRGPTDVVAQCMV